LLELDLVGAALQCDVRPFPFDFPHHGETLEDRQRFAGLVERTLTEKGLATDRGFEPEFASTVGLFARAPVSIAVLGSAGERSYLARASTDGHHAVLAAQHDQIIRFDTLAPEGLVRAVVGLLPPLKPGPGRSITITADDPAKAQRGWSGADQDLSGQSWLEPARPAQGSAAAQLAAARVILERPRLGSGAFYVIARGRNGRESEPELVQWLDTDAGRYAVLSDTGPDGRLDITYTPADQARIDQALTRLLDRIR
jgi:hypothetical protein